MVFSVFIIISLIEKKKTPYLRLSNSSSLSLSLCSISDFKWFNAACEAWYFWSISCKASSASCKAEARLSLSASNCDLNASKSVRRRLASRSELFNSLTWSWLKKVK